MKIRQRFKFDKFELIPNSEQRQKICQFAGMSRYIYNEGLELQKTSYQTEKKTKLFQSELELTKWRYDPEKPRLKEYFCSYAIESRKDLDRARTSFFKKNAVFPQLKKKNQIYSFRYPDNKEFRLDEQNNKICLPKLNLNFGWIHYRNNQKTAGTLKHVTVIQYTGKCFFRVQTEREVPDPIYPSETKVRINMGIINFSTPSTGAFINPINVLRKEQNTLKKQHAKIANFLHALKGGGDFGRTWKELSCKIRIKQAIIRPGLGHVRNNVWISNLKNGEGH
ncbi:MAG: helix-turn-helix domain-containing protein [Deltaproteobacteria bacterium]|nr:helix-turn-helix domain-containing protein [Deltaproteobacteria bacterium]